MEIIKRPSQVSSYGMIYENDNEEIEVYNGKTFPKFNYNEKPIIAQLKVDELEEFVYLPCKEEDVTNALERLGVEDISEVEIGFENYMMYENMAEIIFQGDFETVNQIAKKLEDVGTKEFDGISELISYTKINKIDELKHL